MTEPVRAGVLLLQGALIAAVAVGIRRRSVPAVVNTLTALGATALPAAAEFVLRSTSTPSVSFGPELALWIAAAGFLHSLGMLGLYESVWWWDHLTHTVSAALVAALAYAGFVVVARYRTGLGPPPGGPVGATLLFVLAVGVFWELIELIARDVGERYGVDPVLVYYGWRDTVLDLVFDLVGAFLVVALDLRVFVPVAGRYPHATGTVILAAGVIVAVGSALMALSVRLGGGDWSDPGT